MSGDETSTFGRELRRRRLAAKITLTELAERVHYSKSHLSKIENGDKLPGIDLARRCDAAVNAAGALVALLPAAQAQQPSHDQDIELAPAGTPTAPVRYELPIDELDTEHSLAAFRSMIGHLKNLGQSLGPSSVVPMLIPQTLTLRRIALRTDPVRSREALLLAAQFAEFTGWMAQEMGNDTVAVRWTDQAVELASAAEDHEFLANAYVRRANIAMYQHDSYGTIRLAQRALAMRTSQRMRGRALLREAQGHALAGDYDAFRQCIDAAAAALDESRQEDSGSAVTGSTKMPDLARFAEAWSLHELGRSGEAVEILTELWGMTARTDGRAWARTGARLALALASIAEVQKACDVARGVIALFPGIESATIRADLRQLARALNRWNASPIVREIMPALSAALTPLPIESTLPLPEHLVA